MAGFGVSRVEPSPSAATVSYFSGLDIYLLLIQTRCCKANVTTDLILHMATNYLSLYLIKYSPHRKVFQIKYVDHNYIYTYIYVYANFLHNESF
jgi:hypothetical protein